MSIEVVAIAVSVLSAVIGALLQWGTKQTIARVYDKIGSVQTELTEHKHDCEKVDKAVLQHRVTAVEAEVKGFRKFAHWATNGLIKLGTKADVQLPEREQ
jgi:hypothetical protein